MFTIVKLNAINSTNSYLKKQDKAEFVKNLTVVVAKNQLYGRGQMQAKWQSEPGKNLTFSILYRFKNLKLSKQVYLNCAVSLAIYKAVFPIIGKSLTIKWPNDIMADSKKLGGVLIENTVKSGLIKRSIIGIGLNVNQTVFPKKLVLATSLKIELKKEFDLDIILDDILNELLDTFKMIESKSYKTLFELYHKNLYKINQWSYFVDENKKVFRGKIEGVNIDGTLSVALDNGNLKSFANKTIRFLQ